MNANLQYSPAAEVWRRFCGMFGAESVERKYGKTIPPEWKAMLGRLKEFEIDRGIRRLAYSGKAHVPALPEFVKLCRTIGDSTIDEGPQNVPALPAPANDPDKWAIAANGHLLKYITTKVSAEPLRYGQPASYVGMKTMTTPNADASPEFVRAVGILVRFKNLWADQMRLDATDDGVPSEEQQELWVECMKRAEAEIANAAA